MLHCHHQKKFDRCFPNRAIPCNKNRIEHLAHRTALLLIHSLVDLRFASGPKQRTLDEPSLN